MQNIQSRRILVTRYPDNVGIMMSWCEVGKDDVNDMQSKHFHFYNTEVFHKLEEVVNRIARKWERVFIGAFGMATTSEVLDTNPIRFDWILEHADETGDVFLHSFERL